MSDSGYTPTEKGLLAIIAQARNISHGPFGPWEDDLCDYESLSKILSQSPADALAAHDAVIRADELKATAQEFLNASNAGIEPGLNRLAAKLLFRRAARIVQGDTAPTEGTPTMKAIRAQSFTGTEEQK